MKANNRQAMVNSDVVLFLMLGTVMAGFCVGLFMNFLIIWQSMTS